MKMISLNNCLLERLPVRAALMKENGTVTFPCATDKVYSKYPRNLPQFR